MAAFTFSNYKTFELEQINVIRKSEEEHENGNLMRALVWLGQSVSGTLTLLFYGHLKLLET